LCRTTLNVLPDDGPVMSETCRSLEFFRNNVVNLRTVCARLLVKITEIQL